MPRYFFDSADGEYFVRDDGGLEFEGIEAARQAATEGLADLARDALKSPDRREMSIEIRDENGRKVLRLRLQFDIEPIDVDE
jgi:hypothetical protein